MAAELRFERERTSLVIEELTNLLDGGELFTEKRRKMGKPLRQTSWDTGRRAGHFDALPASVKIV